MDGTFAPGSRFSATHAIPRVDSFSSTMSGKPWFAWEWLYDLVVGRLEAGLGLNGVVWFTAVRDCGSVRLDVPFADRARDEHLRCAGAGVAGDFGVDDSFSGAAARR